MKYIEDFNGRLRYRKRRDAFVDTQRIVLEDERLSGTWVRHGEKNKDRLQKSGWDRCYPRRGRIAVVQDPLVNVARALSVAYPKKWIVAVNPGSATRPGGRVHIGEPGVEESLCLCSDLYSTLAKPGIWKKFYMKHLTGIYNKTEYPELMDEWLYSGDVTIFKEIRDGVPELLPENEWGHIDVITSAPPGALADDLWTGYSGSSAMAKAILRSVHLLQGRNIFEAAIHEGGEYGEKMPHILVLPAFGCNLVWEDPTNLVAETYADLLTNYAKYFDMVVFAAGRRSNVFCEAFEEKGLTLQTLEDIQETWQEEPEWEEPESEKEGKPYSTELLLHAMFGDVEWLEMNDAWKQDPSKEAWVREMVEKAEQCALKETQEKQQAEKAEKELEKELKEPVLRQMAEYSGGVSAEPNNKFFDVTGSILTAGWKCEAWKDKAWKNKAWKDNADWYRAGIFTDGKSFVEEGIRLPEDGINGAQEYRCSIYTRFLPMRRRRGRRTMRKRRFSCQCFLRRAS
ncbi:TIGR02452 family protein [Selenomonas sp. CM52]|uniref:TIGR02452 family protein n=1 Tax=Selenomonas sp. CM52 TaxID=936381 RepID=UPI001E395067|nr:TIGR02452 family protein [Selenomonas sp. CM52]